MGRNTQTTIRVELGFLNDRILFNTTHVRNNSSNQLLSYALPSITGQNGIYKNLPATVQNTGWEFSLNTTNLKTPIYNWSTTFNLTLPRNKLTAFPNLSSSTYKNIYFIGYPTSVDFIYHFLGTDPATGEYLVADANGKATATPNFSTDRTILLSTQPTLLWRLFK